MSTVTESDIKELKDLINSQFDEVKNRLSSLEIGQAEMRGKLASMETSTGKIPDLAEKLGELKNWKQIGVVVITAFISSIFSGLIGGVIGWLIRSTPR